MVRQATPRVSTDTESDEADVIDPQDVAANNVQNATILTTASSIIDIGGRMVEVRNVPFEETSGGVLYSMANRDTLSEEAKTTLFKEAVKCTFSKTPIESCTVDLVDEKRLDELYNISFLINNKKLDSATSNVLLANSSKQIEQILRGIINQLD
jgi:hypothetical protein